MVEIVPRLDSAETKSKVKVVWDHDVHVIELFVKDLTLFLYFFVAGPFFDGEPLLEAGSCH